MLTVCSPVMRVELPKQLDSMFVYCARVGTRSRMRIINLSRIKGTSCTVFAKQFCLKEQQ